MLKLEMHNSTVEIHAEGSASTIETEIVAACIAVIRMYAKAKHISFEAASLTLMQNSNIYNSMAEEFKIGDD